MNQKTQTGIQGVSFATTTFSARTITQQYVHWFNLRYSPLCNVCESENNTLDVLFLFDAPNPAKETFEEKVGSSGLRTQGKSSEQTDLSSDGKGIQ